MGTRTQFRVVMELFELTPMGQRQVTVVRVLLVCNAILGIQYRLTVHKVMTTMMILLSLILSLFVFVVSRVAVGVSGDVVVVVVIIIMIITIIIHCYHYCYPHDYHRHCEHDIIQWYDHYINYLSITLNS